MRVLTEEEMTAMMEELSGRYGEALRHVMHIEATSGPDSHSLTSCPPYSRAMCRYYDVLKDYKF